MPRRLALLAFPLIALTACGHEDPAPSPPTSPTTVTSAPPTEVDGVRIQSEPAGTPTEGDPPPAPANEEETQGAIAAATATMNIWVQGSTLDERTWRDELNKTLTEPGQSATSTTWGYRVRDTAVTGPGEVLRANSGSAVVRIATDHTSYDVTVVKNPDGTWLTSNLAPVGAEGSGA